MYEQRIDLWLMARLANLRQCDRRVRPESHSKVLCASLSQIHYSNIHTRTELFYAESWVGAIYSDRGLSLRVYAGQQTLQFGNY